MIKKIKSLIFRFIMFIIRDEINALIQASAYSLISRALSSENEIKGLIHKNYDAMLDESAKMNSAIAQVIVDYKAGQQALLEDLEIAKGKLAKAEGTLHDSVEHGKFLLTKIEATQERHVQFAQSLAKALGQG